MAQPATEQRDVGAGADDFVQDAIGAEGRAQDDGRGCRGSRQGHGEQELIVIERRRQVQLDGDRRWRALCSPASALESRKAS